MQFAYSLYDVSKIKFFINHIMIRNHVVFRISKIEVDISWNLNDEDRRSI